MARATRPTLVAMMTRDVFGRICYTMNTKAFASKNSNISLESNIKQNDNCKRRCLLLLASYCKQNHREHEESKVVC